MRDFRGVFEHAVVRPSIYFGYYLREGKVLGAKFLVYCDLRGMEHSVQTADAGSLHTSMDLNHGPSMDLNQVYSGFSSVIDFFFLAKCMPESRTVVRF